MSKRIEELAKQYNDRIDPGNHFVNQQVLEEFAKAVVREAASRAGWSQGHAQRHILEHFELDR